MCKQLLFPEGFSVSRDKKVYTPKISDIYRVLHKEKIPADADISSMAVANDLCSNHWNLPFTPDELRKLATPGERENGSNPEFTLRSQPLPRRLGPKKVTDIMQRYEAGESARSLADRHGVATSALIRLLRENNVVVRKRKVTDAETRRMAKDYKAGATMRELEAKYGLSHGAVSRALHRVGTEMRENRPRLGRPNRKRPA